MKWQLQAQLNHVLQTLGYELPTPAGLSFPANPDFGHYATNVTFQLAKIQKTNPKLLAETIATQLEQSPTFKGKLQCSAVNGFINFTFSNDQLWALLTQLEGVSFPKTTEKILLEYVSANPTGPLHIGHGRWAALGDSLYRILAATGHQVQTEFYINDAGNQVQKLYESVQAVKAQTPIPEDGYHGAYIHDLAALGDDPLKQNLKWQHDTLAAFRTHFHSWVSEKSLQGPEKIQNVLDILRQKGLSFESEGALWFRSTEFGDDKDRVLIKSDGANTYFLMDLVYHLDKIQRGFTLLINIWGADHHGYVKRVRAGVQALGGEQFAQDAHFKIMIGQLVNLFRGGEPVRMSKRTGDMITLQEVIDEIGTDAARYFLIEKSPDSHVEFDLAVAVQASSENPVYYIQYAHARLCNVLAKLADQGTPEAQSGLPQLGPDEAALIWQCLKWSDAIWEAAQNLAPHQMAHYAWGLAKKVQLFYERCPVLKASPAEQHQRLEIIKHAKETLRKSLDVLGMSAPEKM